MPAPAAPPPAGPTAVIAAPADVETAGGTSEQVFVNYSGARPIDLATITPAGLTVAGPSGPLDVTGVSVRQVKQGGGDSVTAVYTVAARGGAWAASADGAYAVSTAAGTVRDVTGQPAAAATASFDVSVGAAASMPPVDPAYNGGNAVTVGFVTRAAVTDGDYRTVFVGYTGDPASGASRSVVQRFNRDGSLDTSFGLGGEIAGAAGDALYAVATDSDQRLLVVGSRGPDVLVQRASSPTDPRTAASGTPERPSSSSAQARQPSPSRLPGIRSRWAAPRAAMRLSPCSRTTAGWTSPLKASASIPFPSRRASGRPWPG